MDKYEFIDLTIPRPACSWPIQEQPASCLCAAALTTRGSIDASIVAQNKMLSHRRRWRFFKKSEGLESLLSYALYDFKYSKL